MANVQAIQDFQDAVNEAVNALLVVREDLSATDRLWPVLPPAAKVAIKAHVEANLAAAQLLTAALLVP